MFPHGAQEDEDNMPKFYQFLSSAVNRHPKMLKFVARAGRLYHKRVGSRRFLETILCQSKADKKVIDDPNNFDAITQGFKFGAQYSRQAFLYDYGAISPNSRQELIDLSCPVYAIIGTEEKNSRKKRTERLIEAGANMEIISAQGGGELLFFSHPDEIIGALDKAWSLA
jgi:pimeloyl-ACP methyl ester carboxylesterase